MNKLIIFSLLISFTLSVKWHQLENYSFEDYQNEYSKYYDDENEYSMRKQIFDNNLQNIKYHNILPGQTYKKGVNQFTDLTQQELQKYLGFNKQVYESDENVTFTLVSYNSTYDLNLLSQIPQNKNWSDAGIISPIKDQGQCGSCWAHATVEQVESYLALNTGILATLSVGEIVSCTPNPNQCGGTGGCNGADVRMGTQYIVDNGITTEWKVPYVSYFGNVPNCSAAMQTNNPNNSQYIKENKVHVQTNGRLISNSYNDFMFHLAYVGPLGIGVDANSWFEYEEGIYNGCADYSNVTMDHNVQLVGYGTDENLGDYFLVRNSWGISYGERGYIRLNRNTTCGTDLFPLQNSGCAVLNQTTPITVCGQCGILWGGNFPINVTMSGLNKTQQKNKTSTNTNNTDTKINGTKLEFNSAFRKK